MLTVMGSDPSYVHANLIYALIYQISLKYLIVHITLIRYGQYCSSIHEPKTFLNIANIEFRMHKNGHYTSLYFTYILQIIIKLQILGKTVSDIEIKCTYIIMRYEGITNVCVY